MVKVLQRKVKKTSKKQQRDNVVKITRIAFNVRGARAPQIRVYSNDVMDEKGQQNK